MIKITTMSDAEVLDLHPLDVLVCGNVGLRFLSRQALTAMCIALGVEEPGTRRISCPSRGSRKCGSATKGWNCYASDASSRPAVTAYNAIALLFVSGGH